MTVCAYESVQNIYAVEVNHLVLLDIVAGSQVRVSEQGRCTTGNLNWTDRVERKEKEATLM